MGNLNPLFEGEHEADPKDLIFFLIDALNKELIAVSQNINFNIQELNSQNEQTVIKNFLNEYNLKRTFVSNIFFGIKRTVKKCVL